MPYKTNYLNHKNPQKIYVSVNLKMGDEILAKIKQCSLELFSLIKEQENIILLGNDLIIGNRIVNARKQLKEQQSLLSVKVQLMTETQAERCFPYVFVCTEKLIRKGQEFIEAEEIKTIIQQNNQVEAVKLLKKLLEKTNFRGFYLGKILEIIMLPFVVESNRISKKKKIEELKHTKVKKLSEEFQIELMKTLQTALAPFKQLSQNSAFKEFAKNAEFPGFFACIIGNLLDKANKKEEKGERQVQIEALRTLDEVIEVFIHEDEPKLIIQFIPGFSQNLLDILIGDFKQGSEIFELAGHLWSKILKFIFKNQLLPKLENETPNSANELFKKLKNFQQPQSEHNIANYEVLGRSILPLTIAFRKLFILLSNLDQQNDWKVSFMNFL